MPGDRTDNIDPQERTVPLRCQRKPILCIEPGQQVSGSDLKLRGYRLNEQGDTKNVD